MEREEILNIVQELLRTLEKKKITPREAETVGHIFQKSIRESNEREKEKYMEESVFLWKLPKKEEEFHATKNQDNTCKQI